MTLHPIKSINDVYAFTDVVIKAARREGRSDIASQFESALAAGSSLLEILGRIRTAVLDNKSDVCRYSNRSEADEVVAFVERAYGMR